MIGTSGAHCRNESENEGTHSKGLDVVRWEGDSNRDIETLVEEGTRKHGRAHGIDRVRSSSLIWHGAEGEAAHNEAARRQGIRVTLIARGGAVAAGENSLEGDSASPSVH